MKNIRATLVEWRITLSRYIKRRLGYKQDEYYIMEDDDDGSKT